MEQIGSPLFGRQILPRFIKNSFANLRRCRLPKELVIMNTLAAGNLTSNLVPVRRRHATLFDENARRVAGRNRFILKNGATRFALVQSAAAPCSFCLTAHSESCDLHAVKSFEQILSRLTRLSMGQKPPPVQIWWEWVLANLSGRSSLLEAQQSSPIPRAHIVPNRVMFRGGDVPRIKNWRQSESEPHLAFLWERHDEQRTFEP